MQKDEIKRKYMEWIKINPNHRPAEGHAVYSTFNPEEGGTLYYVREIKKDGFTVQSHANNDGTATN